MLLTSLTRMYNYIATVSSGTRSTLTDNYVNDGELLSWIASASDMVEDHINRTIEYTTHTQYFDTSYNRREYFVDAYPIASITSVKEDSDGLFDGSEVTLGTDEYHISSDSNSVILESDLSHVTKRGLQIVYVGGLAAHAVNTVVTIGSVVGTWTVGKYVKGTTSSAVGVVRVASTTALTIETLYGVWVSGEIVTEYDEEAGTTAGDATATISAITSRSLSEAYPALCRACEIEVRYMWQHKLDMENDSTQLEGVRQRDFGAKYDLLPQTQKLLRPYVRMLIV